MKKRAWKSDISRNEKMEEKLKNGEKRARNGGIEKNRKKDKNELRKGKKRLKRGKCSKGWTKKQKKQAREAAKGRRS